MSQDELSQPTLPGMDHLGAQFAPVKAARQQSRPPSDAEVPGSQIMAVTAARKARIQGAARQWSGAIPGQQVMPHGGPLPTRFDPHSPSGPQMETDEHGFVKEPRGQQSDHLVDFYQTHGGRYAKTPEEHHMELGASPHQARKLVASEWSGMESELADAHDTVKATHDHWDAQPLHHINADTPIHTGQSTHETTVQANGRQRVDKIRDSLESGEEMRKPAWLVKSQDRLYSLDGHHRMLAAREAGNPDFPARVWDLDKNPPARALRNPLRSRGGYDSGSSAGSSNTGSYGGGAWDASAGSAASSDYGFASTDAHGRADKYAKKAFKAHE